MRDSDDTSQASTITLDRDTIGCVVRSFASSDTAAVKLLLRHGLLPGHVEIDMEEAERIQRSHLYARLGRGHFWVAEINEEVVGTVAIIEVDRDVAQLRWLRVAPDWQSTYEVARHLIRVATEHAREMEFLKLIVHAPPDIQPRAVNYFHVLGFGFAKNRMIAGRHMLEFYVDLYKQRPPRSRDGRPRYRP